ncbi:unnamed protein product [Coffea canephora]|uniref:Uncharacterized protein n=1 Tax=Coffea canephora TaxID=49390 RepID=A0A068V333_COFCA|nr:unnamed protein product [Coffea canephora]
MLHQIGTIFFIVHLLLTLVLDPWNCSTNQIDCSFIWRIHSLVLLL